MINGKKSIILYDGNCSFCFHSMLFIKRKLKRDSFDFISIESEEGKQLCEKYRLRSVDSVVLIEGEKAFIYSSAILRICGELVFPYQLMKLFLIFPSFILDALYKTFAANRYRWFGKKDNCDIIPGSKIN